MYLPFILTLPFIYGRLWLKEKTGLDKVIDVNSHPQNIFTVLCMVLNAEKFYGFKIFQKTAQKTLPEKIPPWARASCVLRIIQHRI